MKIENKVIRMSLFSFFYVFLACCTFIVFHSYLKAPAINISMNDKTTTLVQLLYVGRPKRKGTLKHMQTAKIQTSLRTAQAGLDLRCLPTQDRDLVEFRGIIAKILTRCLTVQNALGLRHSYIPWGSFRQPATHVRNQYQNKQTMCCLLVGQISL